MSSKNSGINTDKFIPAIWICHKTEWRKINKTLSQNHMSLPKQNLVSYSFLFMYTHASKWNLPKNIPGTYWSLSVTFTAQGGPARRDGAAGGLTGASQGSERPTLSLCRARFFFWERDTSPGVKKRGLFSKATLNPVAVLYRVTVVESYSPLTLEQVIHASKNWFSYL